jgi:hypothetical protein
MPNDFAMACFPFAPQPENPVLEAFIHMQCLRYFSFCVFRFRTLDIRQMVQRARQDTVRSTVNDKIKLTTTRDHADRTSQAL